MWMVVALNRATAFRDLTMKEVEQTYQAREWAVKTYNMIQEVEKEKEVIEKLAKAPVKKRGKKK